MTVPWKGDNWDLIALLKYEPAELSKLVEVVPRANRVPRVPKEYLAWFPGELQKKYAGTREDPPGFIPIDAVTLSAQPFTHSPLNDGTVQLISEQGLVFVVLGTQ